MLSKWLLVWLISFSKIASKGEFPIVPKQQCEVSEKCECGKNISTDITHPVCTKNQFCYLANKKLSCITDVLGHGNTCTKDEGCACNKYRDPTIGAVFMLACQKGETCYKTDDAFVCADKMVKQNESCDAPRTCFCEAFKYETKMNYGIVCAKGKYCTGDETRQTACADSLVLPFERCPKGVCVCKNKQEGKFANKFCKENEICAYDGLDPDCVDDVIAFGQACMKNRCACGATGKTSTKFVHCGMRSMCAHDKTLDAPMCATSYMEEGSQCRSPAGCFCRYKWETAEQKEKYCDSHDYCVFTKNELSCLKGVIHQDTFCSAESCWCLPLVVNKKIELSECKKNNYCVLTETGKSGCIAGTQGKRFMCNDDKGCVCTFDDKIEKPPVCNKGQICFNNPGHLCDTPLIKQRQICNNDFKCLCTLADAMPTDGSEIDIITIPKGMYCSKIFDEGKNAFKPEIAGAVAFENQVCTVKDCECRKDDKSTEIIFCGEKKLCFEKKLGKVGTMICADTFIKLAEICNSQDGCVCQEAAYDPKVGPVAGAKRAFCQKGEQCSNRDGTMQCLKVITSDGVLCTEPFCNCYYEYPSDQLPKRETQQAVKCLKGEYCAHDLVKPLCIAETTYNPSKLDKINEGFPCGVITASKEYFKFIVCLKLQKCVNTDYKLRCEDSDLETVIHDGTCYNFNGGCACMKDGKRKNRCRGSEVCQKGDCDSGTYKTYSCDVDYPCQCGAVTWRDPTEKEYCDIGTINKWKSSKPSGAELTDEIKRKAVIAITLDSVKANLYVAHPKRVLSLDDMQEQRRAVQALV